ncbi:HAD-IA family hydrolase [Paenibacillus chitinolyticus]|uniref:HAD-IA family hydrolase n=1 Tax=Paenibacillus chitinolyticus TaxID=79263 RepID=UPI001C48E352|nr:HAD-IA family hydrolase [Paenibacillus chitinolyticus]
MEPILIFDFDGTIVDSKGLAVQLFNELAVKFGGRRIEEAEIGRLSGLSVPDRLKALHVPLFKLPALLLEAKRNYKQAAVSLQPADGMKELLLALKEQGRTMGILSSNTAENIRHFLDLHGLEMFDFVHSATNLFGKDKAIRGMLRAHSLPADRIIYVGDELRDVEACRRAGVRAAAVTWGFDSEELLAGAGPDYVCRTPEQLAAVLR